MTRQSSHTFRTLHDGDTPLLLNNIWDPASALLVEDRGAQVLATSSASLAWSLGYSDGGSLPTSLLVDAVRQILTVTSLPLSVDVENGYSDSPDEVAELVYQLSELGVIGINIEDGEAHPKLLAEKIAAIRRKVGEGVFINARTDVVLRDLYSGDAAIAECVDRAAKYREAGADGFFVPGTEETAFFESVCGAVSLPVNAMVTSLTDDQSGLIQAGVRRLSVGPMPFLRAYQTLWGSDCPLDFKRMNGLTTRQA